MAELVMGSITWGPYVPPLKTALPGVTHRSTFRFSDPFTDVAANDPIPAEEDPDGIGAGVAGLVVDVPPPPPPDPDDDEEDE